MIQVIWNFELNVLVTSHSLAANYALLKMHFLQLVHFLAPRVGYKSSFLRLPRFQRQEGGDVEKRKG